MKVKEVLEEQRKIITKERLNTLQQLKREVDTILDREVYKWSYDNDQDQYVAWIHIAEEVFVRIRFRGDITVLREGIDAHADSIEWVSMEEGITPFDLGTIMRFVELVEGV